MKKYLIIAAAVAAMSYGAYAGYKHAYMKGARAGFDYAKHVISQHYFCVPARPSR